MNQSTLKILFVDDDPDDLEFYGEGIRNIDPEVSIIEARSGLKALEYLHQAKQEGDLPSLIVLDINMPVMSGKETLLEIKKDEALATIPIVIFSTASSPKEKQTFEAFEVSYFTKPSCFSDMQMIARKLLSHSSQNHLS
jgi:CheY-like chemotaxis protein